MKRLRSYGDDLSSASEKDLNRTSSHHRRFHPKLPENGRRRPSPAIDDDRNRECLSRGFSVRKKGEHEFGENSFDDRRNKRLDHDSEGLRKRGESELSLGFDDRRSKRLDHESEGLDRRKGFDRYGGGVSSSMASPRGGGYRERERERDRERIERSESFCVSRRGEFPKGFRSERHWSRREREEESSWRRFDGRGKKDVAVDEDGKGSGSGFERGGSCSSKGGGAGGGCTSSRESLRSRSPQRINKDNVKSPTWSKDSTKDSRDSVNEKKNESMVAESGGSGSGSRSGSRSGSEMEEGELQPESLRVLTAGDVKVAAKPTPEEEKLECKTSGVGNEVVEDVTKNLVVKGVEATEKQDSAVKDECSLENRLPECSDKKGGEEFDEMSKDKPLAEPEKEELRNDFDLEVGLEESNKPSLDEAQKEEPEPKPDRCVVSVKDKGKGVAVCSPEDANFRENDLPVERNFIDSRDDCMEGPSTRGFQLFSTSAGNRTQALKPVTEKLKLEPLDLSLGLPIVSAPPVSSIVAAAPPNSPPHARSVQSFGTTLRTGSDCFTTSISFSGSQFVHNPSCSLTHNSMDCDFEQSVKSRPLFQGVDWQALGVNDAMPKEIIARQKSMSNANANGSIQLSNASHGVINGRVLQGQQGTPSGLERSVSANFQRQVSGKRCQDDLRSPAQSGGSHDNRSEYGKDRKQVTGEESVSRLFRSSSQRDLEQAITGDRDLVERIIFLIASEPIQAMAWRVHELPERSVVFLKDSTCDMLVKDDNRVKLRTLQEALRKRSDLNLETLLKSHRVQLQILVAIKIGHPDFVQRGDGISSSDLAEIFLGLKCRNSNCRSALPVDECDCRFCSQKDGFCSTCMCLVCSKFDNASNTCGWVGCDVCNHWCHTDCGLLKSYIRNGRSATGAQGINEMQFYCLACEHPSEMFGFVKDVFKTCAAEWKVETLCRELEYVKRIFDASNDTRGKLLHDAAKQLLTRLQAGANALEVCNQIVGFLSDSESKFGSTVGSSGRELQLQSLEKNRRDVSDGVAALSQEVIWPRPVSAKDLSRVDGIAFGLPSLDDGSFWNSDNLGINKKPVVDDIDSIVKVKQAEAQMFQKRVDKMPVVDELDTIVKIKQVEAQMFQKRADDARREAEELKRIIFAKGEKIEEEYASRIAKLCLSEVEERRRQKLEGLQTLERSHREYFNMKTRMEADIKDLLVKMEATRRNLGT